MDLAQDVFLLVFFVILILLLIVYSYHRSKEPTYIVGPVTDGNYAIYWKPTIGRSSQGYISSMNGKIVNETSTDNSVTSANSVWHFQNNLDSQGNNYYITQKATDGTIVYLSSDAGEVVLRSDKSEFAVWKVSKIVDDNFTLINMGGCDPNCLALIGNSFRVQDYALKGNQYLCNFNGSQQQMVAEGTRTVQLYAVE